MTADKDALRDERNRLNQFEQMLDAQAQCARCKLCGGKAVITDAGMGAGYYVRCENSGAFRASAGCMVTDCRLGGWAYNVMDWWNRLHDASQPPEAGDAEPDILALADKAVEWALDMFCGYEREEMDAGIAYMRVRGKDRWSMQAQMDHPECFGCDGTAYTIDGEPCPVCQPPEATVSKMEKVALEWIVELARRDIMRTQTDFIGRMNQALGAFEDACDDWADGEVDEALASLAGLALAQLAMVSDPADPLAQLTPPKVEASELREAGNRLAAQTRSYSRGMSGLVDLGKALNAWDAASRATLTNGGQGDE